MPKINSNNNNDNNNNDMCHVGVEEDLEVKAEVKEDQEGNPKVPSQHQR